MDNGIGDDGNNELPWASVFDSSANARALGAIQSEGFRAASELVDRFVRMASTGLAGVNSFRASSSHEGIDHRTDILGATNIEPLIRSWWSMVGQYLLGAVPNASGPNDVAPARDSVPTDQATLDFSGAQARGRLELESAIPGGAVADVWLHNTSTRDLGLIRLRCSDLMADHGAVIAANAVTFSPDEVPMPGRSSRGIDVEIKVADDVVAGVYRGNLLAEGHPNLCLPVVLTVRRSAS